MRQGQLATATVDRIKQTETIFDQLENIKPGQRIIYLVDNFNKEPGQRRDPIRQAAWDAFMRGKCLLVQRFIGEWGGFDRAFEYIAIGRELPAPIPVFRGCYSGKGA